MLSPEEMARRFEHHAPPDAERVKAHEDLRMACTILAGIVDRDVPDGREKSLALTKIEEAMFWANAAIARQ